MGTPPHNGLSADIDRRRLLKAGAVGAAATGALVAGGPKVLGLGTAPVYAAGQSDTGGPDPSIPQGTGKIAVTLNLKWAGGNAQFLFDVPPDDFYVYPTADRNQTPSAVATTGASTGDTSISYTFEDLPPTTYYVDIQEPHQTYINELTIAHDLDHSLSILWNVGPTPLDDFQAVTVTAGATTALVLDVFTEFGGPLTPP